MHARSALASALLLALAGCSTDTPPQPTAGQPLGESQSGIATYYAATGAGSCSYDASPGSLNVVAMNTAQYAGSAACGTCIQVTGPQGSVLVRVVDQCPDCDRGHLDLSREAFAQIAAVEAGRVPIQWQPVACEGLGKLAFRYKEGSSQWWAGLQVLNHRLPVRSLEARVDGRWVALARQDYNYFIAEGGLGVGPYTLRVTASDGQQRTEENLPLRESGVVPGSTQFD